MYESYYGLNEEPFRLSSDYRFSYGHKSYTRARAYMQYAFERAEGFVMITGQPGTGKTTLVNDLTNTLESDRPVKIAMLVTTQMDASDLLSMVAFHFGLDTKGLSKAQTLQALTLHLRRNHQSGGRALLIIDEAQGLSLNSLEELRLLTNLQDGNQPLIQIFLLGQEGLKSLIQRPEMEQVHQRLVATCHLKPLDLEETKAYIQHRLLIAGWIGKPEISEPVYQVIHKFSQGIPRRINLVCSRLMLFGSIEELTRLTLANAKEVIEELITEQLLSADLTLGEEFDQEDWYEPIDLQLGDLEEVEPDASPVESPEPSVTEQTVPLTAQKESELPPPIGQQALLDTLDRSENQKTIEKESNAYARVPIDTELHSRSESRSNGLPYDEGGYQPPKRTNSVGLILLSIVAFLLISTMVLFLINPEGFVEKVYRVLSLI
jgi:type II secretory pathway predicted ATPase ExeA